jgi:hypothetical protein
MTKAQSIKIKALMKVLKGVRERCLDCSAGSSYEVKICHLVKCPIYPWKLGTLNNSNKTTKEKTQTKEKNDIVGVKND